MQNNLGGLTVAFRAVLLCLGAAAALAACTGAAKQSAMMKSGGVGTETTSTNLRIQLTALAEDYSGTIVKAADQIRQESDDSEIRRNAQIWKINAVPSIQSALFLPDPAAATLETWVLCIQMGDYFESEQGGEEFGDWRDFAAGVSRSLETRTESFAKRLTAPEDFQRARSTVRSWASDHPIRDLSFSRDLFMAELARGTFGDKLEGLEGLTALSTTAQDLKLLQSRLNLFNRYLPSSIRWEAELIADDLSGRTELEEVQESLRGFSESLSRLASSLETLPDFISSETDALYKNVEAERAIGLEALSEFETSTQQYLNSFRQATEEFLRVEREALSADVTAERTALLEALEQERLAIIAALEQERATIFEETEAVSNRLIDQSAREAEALIDRFFLWLLGVSILFAAIILIGIWLFRRHPAQG